MSTVTTNYPVIVAKLAQLAPALRKPVERGLRRGLEAVRTTSQRMYLSGPRPSRLDVVTTRLRNSIDLSTTDDGTNIVGRVGSNVKYAAYHEFGFHGSMHVSGHNRVLSVITARGKVTGAELRMMRGPITDKSGKVVGYKRSIQVALSKKKLVGGGSVYVKPHRRWVDYKGRPYVRPALEKEKNVIAQQVERGLSSAVKAANQ